MGFQLNHKTVAVFSHPNHEIAVLATLRRLGAKVVFLTDGGGEQRVKESRGGLRMIGLEDRAVFLDHTEQSFYDALLALDVGFLRKVALEVRSILRTELPEQILTDAVEYYNPVHDLSLAIVGAADDADWGGIFEVPLLYQKPGADTIFGVQTAPKGCPRTEVALTPWEQVLKKDALQKNYTILRDTLGALLLGASSAIQKETLLPASSPVRMPDEDRVLRYEHRAAALKKEGKVESEITHSYHFLPICRDLLGQPR